MYVCRGFERGPTFARANHGDMCHRICVGMENRQGYSRVHNTEGNAGETHIIHGIIHRDEFLANCFADAQAEFAAEEVALPSCLPKQTNDDDDLVGRNMGGLD